PGIAGRDGARRGGRGPGAGGLRDGTLADRYSRPRGPAGALLPRGPLAASDPPHGGGGSRRHAACHPGPDARLPHRGRGRPAAPEIALAISAESVAARYGGTGRPLVVEKGGRLGPGGAGPSRGQPDAGLPGAASAGSSAEPRAEEAGSLARDPSSVGGAPR